MIHPRRADFEPGGQSGGALRITAPDRAAQAVARVVGAAEGVFFINELEHWHDRAALLFAHEPTVFVDGGDDRPRNEIAVGRWYSAASEDARTAALVLLEDADNAVVLRAVLNRTELRVRLETAANFRLARFVGQ